MSSTTCSRVCRWEGLHTSVRFFFFPIAPPPGKDFHLSIETSTWWIDTEFGSYIHSFPDKLSKNTLVIPSFPVVSLVYICGFHWNVSTAITLNKRQMYLHMVHHKNIQLYILSMFTHAPCHNVWCRVDPSAGHWGRQKEAAERFIKLMAYWQVQVTLELRNTAAEAHGKTD